MRGALTSLALASSLASAGSALAQGAPAGSPTDRPFSTDRPSRGDGPLTVPPGLFQVELDFATYTHDRDKSGGGDIRTETTNVLPFNLRVGLTRDTDLSVIYQSYVSRETTDLKTGARERDTGGGDLLLRVKHNFWGDDGGDSAFALIPFVKLPTDTASIGNGAVEFGLVAPYSLSLTDKLALSLQTEIDGVRRSSGSGYTANFVNVAALSYTFTSRLGAYAEVYTARAAERGARWSTTGDVGVTYLLTPTTQVDVGVNVGLTRAADDVNVFTGISKRF